MDATGLTIGYLVPLILMMLIPLVLYYFLIVGGLKLLKIKHVTRDQIISFLVWLVASEVAIRLILAPALPTAHPLRLLNIVVQLAVLYGLFRYVLKLSGKNLWAMVGYLVVAGIVVKTALAFILVIFFGAAKIATF